MTSNKMFSLNKVAPCKMQPENIETTTTQVTLYQRHYSTKVNATMCRIKHQSIRWFCDSLDLSGIDARKNIITTDIHISPDTCKHAAERGNVKLGYSKNFVKFILEALVFVKKVLHIHKLTGRTLHFGKIRLAASYKNFSLL